MAQRGLELHERVRVSFNVFVNDLCEETHVVDHQIFASPVDHTGKFFGHVERRFKTDKMDILWDRMMVLVQSTVVDEQKVHERRRAGRCRAKKRQVRWDGLGAGPYKRNDDSDSVTASLPP